MYFENSANNIFVNTIYNIIDCYKDKLGNMYWIEVADYWLPGAYFSPSSKKKIYSEFFLYFLEKSFLIFCEMKLLSLRIKQFLIFSSPSLKIFP